MTGPTLCQIPGCHQRGKHWPSCDDDKCQGCLPRLAVEGLACDWHVDRAERNLAELIRLAPDARLVAQGLVRRGTGGGSGKPASRPPLNVDAVDALAHIHNRLARQAIRIAVTRGTRFTLPCLPSCIHPTPSQAHCSVCHETFGSVSGFDRHRRGGQCLDPATIPGIHRNTAGVWRFDGGQNRAAAHRGTPQTDEHDPGVVPVGVDESEAAETALL